MVISNPLAPGRLTHAACSLRRRGARSALRVRCAPFYRRIERRRGAAITVVAVACELVVLAWHILTSGERYRYERATLVREKRRDLERRLGIPAVRRRTAPGEPNLAARRERELVTGLEAEAAYQAEVASRTTKDAAATKGEATVQRSKTHGARRSSHPQRSALPTGSTASDEGGYASSA